jgi:hypothetical protein
MTLRSSLAFAALGFTLAMVLPARAFCADDDEDEAAPTKRKQKSQPKEEELAPPPTLTEADKERFAPAREMLIAYLDALKAKKWDKARAMTHPLTIAAIARVKKRLGEERHSMAPWYWAKDSYYLTNYQVVGMTPQSNGAVVFLVSEDSFQVQEKGEYSGEKSAYLVGRYQGKWYVVDKKTEADGFTKDSLKYGYPNYFDPPPAR